MPMKTSDETAVIYVKEVEEMVIDDPHYIYNSHDKLKTLPDLRAERLE